MKIFKLKCPCCDNYIKIEKRNGDYIAVPFFDIHSPTRSELERLGIELGIEGGEKDELRKDMSIK